MWHGIGLAAGTQAVHLPMPGGRCGQKYVFSGAPFRFRLLLCDGMVTQGQFSLHNIELVAAVGEVPHVVPSALIHFWGKL